MQTYVLENLEKNDRIGSEGFAKAKQEKIHSEGENGMDYNRLIIEMVEKIKNQGTSEYLYKFIKLFLEKWGF